MYTGQPAKGWPVAFKQKFGKNPSELLKAAVK